MGECRRIVKLFLHCFEVQKKFQCRLIDSYLYDGFEKALKNQTCHPDISRYFIGGTE